MSLRGLRRSKDRDTSSKDNPKQSSKDNSKSRSSKAPIISSSAKVASSKASSEQSSSQAPISILKMPSTAFTTSSSNKSPETKTQPPAQQYVVIGQRRPAGAGISLTAQPSSKNAPSQTIVFAGNSRHILASSMYRTHGTAQKKSLPRGWKRSEDPKPPPTLQLTKPGEKRFRGEEERKTDAGDSAISLSVTSSISDVDIEDPCPSLSSSASDDCLTLTSSLSDDSLSEVVTKPDVQRYDLSRAQSSDTDYLSVKMANVQLHQPQVRNVR